MHRPVPVTAGAGFPGRLLALVLVVLLPVSIPVVIPFAGPAGGALAGPPTAEVPGAAWSHPAPTSAAPIRSGAAGATGAAARSAVAARRSADALDVEIASVTPSSLRPGEPLELTGSVTNSDDQVWREVKAYLVISPSPLTTRDQLSAEADSPPESYIGDRILDFGSFARLGRLRTGDASPFTLGVPWRSLAPRISGAEGVYTVGVQVLATDVDGNRDSGQALGRARTFVPLVASEPGAPATPIDLGMLWTLHEPVLRRSDGSYVGAERLATSLALGGRLRRLTDLAGTAGDTPVSLVADPALLSWVSDVADGRFAPPLVAMPRTNGARATPDDDGTQTPDPDGGTDGGTDDGTDDGTAQTDAPSPVAADWLDDVTRLSGSVGWLTGYGEPDPDAVALADAPQLEAAIARAGHAADRLLGGSLPAMSLPDPGQTGSETLTELGGPGGETVVVVSPRLLVDWEADQGVAQTVPTSVGDLRVLVADPTLAAGGPEPGDSDSALQMRQRLLAETALMSLQADDVSASTQQALFVAPRHWDPGPSWPTSAFFAGLTAPWLQPTPVDILLGQARPYSGTVAGVADGAIDPVYPAVTAALADTSTKLARRTRTVSRLLDRNRAVTNWYSAAAALGVSSHARQDALKRLAVTRHTTAELGAQLDQVSLDGPAFVTLSSSSGRFGLTITNALDQPVTVGVRIDADADGLGFETGDPVTVGPGERQTVTVSTQVGDNRVTRARAYLVTPNGARFGKAVLFNVRTSVVGVVVWVVVGLAALLLAVAIARRLVLRVRHGSAGPPETPSATPPATGPPAVGGT